MTNFFYLIKDIASEIFSLAVKIFEWAVDKFLGRDIYERLLLVSFVLAFLAILKPVARYWIYGDWFYINNPLADMLIIVFFIIAVSFFVRPLVAVIMRTAPSAVYFIYTIYLQLSHGISKAPYELTGWQFLNLLVPALAIVLSLMSFFFGREQGR